MEDGGNGCHENQKWEEKKEGEKKKTIATSKLLNFPVVVAAKQPMIQINHPDSTKKPF